MGFRACPPLCYHKRRPAPRPVLAAAGLMLAFIGALGPSPAQAQYLPGFTAPAPFHPPAEEAYRLRTGISPLTAAPAPQTAPPLIPPQNKAAHAAQVKTEQITLIPPPPPLLRDNAGPTGDATVEVLPLTADRAISPSATPGSASRRGPMLTAFADVEEQTASVPATNNSTSQIHTSPPPGRIILRPPTPITARAPRDVAIDPAFLPAASNPAATARPLSRPGKGYDKDAPVDLVADDLQHDDRTGTVTARGNVELVQAGRTLRAQEVSYNLNDGTVRARGNVMLRDINGDTHLADDVELTEEMSNGFVEGLQSYLADGGQFKARHGTRANSTLLTMHEASYTPCDCALDEDGTPVWQIRAEKITYDETAHKVSYKNAKFDLFGVPVLWTPYLAHTDGKIKRKSGLLTPNGGYNSELGIILTQKYYIDIAPDRDLTIGTMLTTREKPVALGQYRQRWTNAELQLEGSFTHSGRIDDVSGQGISVGDEWRGHLQAQGRWDLNEKWRTGLNLEVTSDDQYLRQYDFSDKDVLESQLYAERFAGRNYAAIRALAFQDVRINELKADQPHILPEAQLHVLGEPNALLGGRWEINAAALGLMREGSGQDMARGIVKAGWQRRDTTSFGLVNTLDLSIRGDAYSVNDRDLALPGSGRSSSGTQTRIFPQAHLVSSLPLVKPLERAQILVEPIAALTVGTNINSDDSAIPNEDSQDVQIDATNLFEPDRFPGFDRIEDRSRVTYGLRSGIYGHQGSHLTGFIGQSYNFNKDDNPFPSGSGLSRQESDYVGAVSAQYDNRYGLNYRFQIGSDDLSSQRHELDSYAIWRRLTLGSRYLFAKGLDGTSIDNSREQIEGGLAYFFTDSWRVRSAALYDLGEDSGLRRAIFGLDYYGCCMNMGITAERKLTADSSGDSGTSIMFRIGLKGLGEFYSPEDHYWGAQGTPLLGRVRY